MADRTFVTVNIRRDYSIDVPPYGTPLAIDEIQRLVTRSGSHFFDDASMRFFRSRVDDYTYAGSDGWYFVTSEKHVSHFAGINEPRMYTVRRLSINDDRTDLRLHELYGFQAFKTLNGARNAARNAAKTGAVVCPLCHCRLMPQTSKNPWIDSECLERIERDRARVADKSTVQE